jgi:hypothetical protein
LLAACAVTGKPNTQHATRNTQHATRNTQHATRNTQQATSNTPKAIRPAMYFLDFTNIWLFRFFKDFYYYFVGCAKGFIIPQQEHTKSPL